MGYNRIERYFSCKKKLKIEVNNYLLYKTDFEITINKCLVNYYDK